MQSIFAAASADIVAEEAREEWESRIKSARLFPSPFLFSLTKGMK